MTYKEALSFFSFHGGVSKSPEELAKITPSEVQLDKAVEHAVKRGQWRERAESAKRAILRGYNDGQNG